MSFNFDRIIDRTGTCSAKYDMWSAAGKPEGILPLWVADMDFAAPPCVEEALSQRVMHGVYGYSFGDESYGRALGNWFATRHSFTIQPDWVVKTTGVVFAVYTALRGLTQAGDAVLIQEPVYYPFRGAIETTKRNVVVNELVYENGGYTIDLADFERKIMDHKVKLFILCSPHNPVGRVWTREELAVMGDICLRHDVIVVSDEIHADFIYTGHRHHVFAGLSQALADITVTCTAPSKTFNLAGLEASNIIISNEALRKSFKEALASCGAPGPGIMGLLACRAAYERGAQWLDELIGYLRGNVDLIRGFLADKLPAIKLVEPEGTYLVWLDCKALGLSGKALDDFIVHKARLWLDDGAMFGVSGEGFQRVNIACPRSTVEQALLRLEEAVKAL